MRTYCFITGLVNTFASVVVGTLVFIKGRPTNLYRTYVLACLAVFVWGINYVLWCLSSSPVEAAFYCRLLMAGAIAITVFYAHHLLLLLNLKYRRVLFGAYVLSALFIAADLLTSEIVNGMRRAFDFPFWPVAGRLYLPMLGFMTCLVIGKLALVYREMRVSTGERKSQLQYVFWGALLAYVGGATNYPLWFGIPIKPYGNPGSSIYLALTSYAILKHRLMDIRVVIRRTLIYSLTSAALTALSLFFMILITRLMMPILAQQLLVSAALSAIAITFLFHPILRAIQNVVDRYFPRESLPPALLREATSGFVHEIKRPLANITVPVELALADLTKLRESEMPSGEMGKIIERLQYVLAQSMEAGEKIEAIRSLWETSQTAKTRVDFSALVEQIVQKESLLFAKRNIKINCDVEEHRSFVFGNPRQLEIAVANLIKNAREAIDASNAVDRRMRLSLRQESSQLTLRVKDTGPGIKEDELPKLFLPYFSTKGSKGMGVGLYIAREIAQAHGGSLSADSEPGKGAEFVLKLPIDQ